MIMIPRPGSIELNTKRVKEWKRERDGKVNWKISSLLYSNYVYIKKKKKKKYNMENYYMNNASVEKMVHNSFFSLFLNFTLNKFWSHIFSLNIFIIIVLYCIAAGEAASPFEDPEPK